MWPKAIRELAGDLAARPDKETEQRGEAKGQPEEDPGGTEKSLGR